MRNTTKITDDATVFAKLPPHAVELEAAVIGCCLNRNGREIFEDVIRLVKDAKAFYKSEHQKIYAAMQRLYLKGSPIDLMLVSDELGRTKELDFVGGFYGLTQIAERVVSEAYATDYAKIIQEKFLARELIRINGEAINKAYDGTHDIFELIQQNCERHYELTFANIQQEPMDAERLGWLLEKQLRAQKDSPNDITGITTGFKDLDGLTNGWQKTDLTIIAARPSVGKTAFALALAMAAIDEMCPTLIFSLELGKTQIAARMISSMSEVELTRIMRPKEMSGQEWQRFDDSGEIFRGYPLYLDDTAAINLVDMRAKVRRMKMKNGIQMVIVDYLQLMSGLGNEGNREQEIARISRGLKALAKDFDIPVIALSQLNRNIENAAGECTRDPRLSDLRESGAIEQDADNVLFITEPGADIIKSEPSLAGKKILTIAKGRNIGQGKLFLEFNGDIQRWREPRVF